MQAPIPENEGERQRVLDDYEILDTIEEQAYDDITMLASHICQTPIALISLVDRDRQWFKSRVGLQAEQTPREYAFCAHAILRPGEVFVVADASEDQRFADNPLVVQDPRIRFYAGAPLVAPDGSALGTVCVVDRAPRQLDDRSVEALRALSRQVVAQLELRKALRDVQAWTEAQQEYQQRLEAYQGQLEEANVRLLEQSSSDQLTGLLNRRAFQQRIEEECERSARSGAPLSLLMLDVDRFKSYNDEFGHPAGDEALRQVGRVLKTASRVCDAVARYGGEEFAVILPNTGSDGASVLGERLRRAVAAAPWPKRSMTISVGTATAEGKPDADALVSRTDQALYHAKNQGRNRVWSAERPPA